MIDIQSEKYIKNKNTHKCGTLIATLISHFFTVRDIISR